MNVFNRLETNANTALAAWLTPSRLIIVSAMYASIVEKNISDEATMVWTVAKRISTEYVMPLPVAAGIATVVWERLGETKSPLLAPFEEQLTQATKDGGLQPLFQVVEDEEEQPSGGGDPAAPQTDGRLLQKVLGGKEQPGTTITPKAAVGGRKP